MKYAWLACLMFGSLLIAGTQDSEFNVNSRYTVEAVSIAGDGWTTDPAADRDGKLSLGLRREIAALIGEKLNPASLDEMARRLRKEFHARTVEHHVLRGKMPEYVQVVFEIKLRPTRFDVSVPKFLYNSEQQWTGAVELTASAGHSGVTAGLVSDGDELAERYTGVVARYQNTRLGSDRVHLRFQVESYHQQWNANTLAALPTAVPETSGAYRARQNFEPEVSFELARSLTLGVGTSFERMEQQYPSSHIEAANAMTAGLRYHRRLENAGDEHDLDATYNLRAATHLLGSDFAYARHRVEFRYMLTRGRSVVIDDVSLGTIAGQAPLFERFILGNSSTLRGWNKYDLDPIGGNRMVHNSVEYRYGVLQVFYDSGAVWDRTETATLRHSAGVGLRQGPFSVAVAFPVREGRIDPILMVGMNY